MCGILGTIGIKNDPRLKIDSLVHRGPDGTGSWSSVESEFPVTLGHTRLSILDLSKNADQPMLCMDDRFIFVFNGEIYNFIELKSYLEKLGNQFFTESDSEVFLRGLIQEGPSFQLRCNGMWSFCLWDRKLKKALFGRDRFGKKPFFYSILGKKELVFASEMKAITPFLASIEHSEKIDIHLRRLFDYEGSEECVIRGIKRLPPGHFAEFNDGDLKVSRWWNTLDHLEDVPKNYNDQVEKWREIFLDAVKIRMRSDVRIGTALSGGLDSSATFTGMAFLAGQNTSNLREASDWQHGFCAHYPGSSLDEVKWARLVTDSIGVPLKKVEIDPLETGWSISEAMNQVEDPYLTLPTPMLATYRAISKAGIKVTLDGHGADELFSGYGHLTHAFKDSGPKQSAELLAIIKSFESGTLNINHNHIHGRWLKQRLIEFLRTHASRARSLMNGVFSKTNWDLIRHKLEYADQQHSEFKNFDSLTKSLYEIFHVTILPTLLRNYDRYSMASGVEIRMPFMDHRLVSYTFSLPWTSKVGGGFSKRIMRDALKGILPEDIRTRRDKIGWNAPLHEWLRGQLKDEIEILLSNGNFPTNIHNAWKELQLNSNANFYDGQKVWNLLMPIIWKESAFTS